jgi:hypothetical protein
LHRTRGFSAPPKKGVIGHQFESPRRQTLWPVFANGAAAPTAKARVSAFSSGRGALAAFFGIGAGGDTATLLELRASPLRDGWAAAAIKPRFMPYLRWPFGGRVASARTLTASRDTHDACSSQHNAAQLTHSTSQLTWQFAASLLLVDAWACPDRVRRVCRTLDWGCAQ